MNKGIYFVMVFLYTFFIEMNSIKSQTNTIVTLEEILGNHQLFDITSSNSMYELTIRKNLVELLNGKLWVDSQKDKGSTFYFTLPFSKLAQREKL
jgi:light-regulated signal transduction histidine kinase (bacteriophytochrome)